MGSSIICRFCIKIDSLNITFLVFLLLAELLNKIKIKLLNRNKDSPCRVEPLLDDEHNREHEDE